MFRLRQLERYRDLFVDGTSREEMLTMLNVEGDKLDLLAEICVLPCSVQQKWCDGGITEDGIGEIVRAAAVYRKECGLAARTFSQVCSSYGIYLPR